MTFKAVPIPLASGKTGWIFAGPTADMPPGCELIRCAAEITTPPAKIAYDVATKDFSIFDRDIILDVLPDILADLEKGRALYIGCMGGTGRTGTLLAILVGQHPAFDGHRAREYVRQVYRTHAVETADQFSQVIDLADYKVSPSAPFTQVGSVDDFDIGGPEMPMHASARKGWAARLWAALVG